MLQVGVHKRCDKSCARAMCFYLTQQNFKKLEISIDVQWPRECFSVHNSKLIYNFHRVNVRRSVDIFWTCHIDITYTFPTQQKNKKHLNNTCHFKINTPKAWRLFCQHSCQRNISTKEQGLSVENVLAQVVFIHLLCSTDWTRVFRCNWCKHILTDTLTASHFADGKMGFGAIPIIPPPPDVVVVVNANDADAIAIAVWLPIFPVEKILPTQRW